MLAVMLVPTDRPDTPVLPPSATAGREAAAVLLQRLLRGRAAQNVMYEGKTRCQALIQELSLEGHGELGGQGGTGGRQSAKGEMNVLRARGALRHCLSCHVT